jgi:trimethylamine--corrinoid protein Co-methyltransferase
VVDRQSWDAWQEGGALDARERAREVARDILANHRPEPLDPTTESWIRERFELFV